MWLAIGRRGPARWLPIVAIVVFAVVAAAADDDDDDVTTESPSLVANSSALPPQQSSSGGPAVADEEPADSDRDRLDLQPTTGPNDAKDTFLAKIDDKGHSGHSEHSKPMKTKKKKPMGKHKKKKQTFKDKLLPLLLIPFVIQTMLIPMFIMNLKLLAMKAMTVGKFAILLIAFNMFRSWSQNAHSTSVRGTMNSLMAQNYGYNGGPEFGAFFNGR